MSRTYIASKQKWKDNMNWFFLQNEGLKMISNKVMPSQGLARLKIGSSITTLVQVKSMYRIVGRPNKKSWFLSELKRPVLKD